MRADYSWNGFRGNIGWHVQTESRPRLAMHHRRIVHRRWLSGQREQRHNDFLPNINIVYDFANDLVLRFSAAKVISRPNYGDMSSYLWLGPQTLTGGVADLDRTAPPARLLRRVVLQRQRDPRRHPVPQGRRQHLVTRVPSNT